MIVSNSFKNCGFISSYESFLNAVCDCTINRDEAYLLYVFVGHVIYQRIRSGEEFSLTLHFADEYWIRDVK